MIIGFLDVFAFPPTPPEKLLYEPLLATSAVYLSFLTRVKGATLHEEDAKSKAALSFLSMGLPAWLATAHADSRRMSSHFKWLCEVGEFLGWIDDIVDMEEDYASGFANRIVVRLRTSKEPRSRVLESLADEVACLGRRIADEWSRNLRSPGAGRNSLDSFKTNVSLWLDGPRNLAV
jgi:hypothetical protein